jgi:hypothetical protein
MDLLQRKCDCISNAEISETFVHDLENFTPANDIKPVLSSSIQVPAKNPVDEMKTQVSRL